MEDRSISRMLSAEQAVRADGREGGGVDAADAVVVGEEGVVPPSVHS